MGPEKVHFDQFPGGSAASLGTPLIHGALEAARPNGGWGCLSVGIKRLRESWTQVTYCQRDTEPN